MITGKHLLILGSLGCAACGSSSEDPAETPTGGCDEQRAPLGRLASIRGWVDRVDRVLARVLLALVVALWGCGASPSSSDESKKSPWPGFELIKALGGECTASVAIAPEAEYQPLTFIPCQSGQPGCSELQFDGVLSGGLYEFEFGLAFDPSGAPTRLLVVHRRSSQNPAERVPLEAVVYDLASGVPIFAVRSGQDSFQSPSGSGSFGSSSSHCSVLPAIGSDRLSLLALPSGKSVLSVGQAGYADAASLELRETEADGSALARAMASDDTLAAAQPDGRIHRFRFDGSPDVAAYGPDVKVYLSAVHGSDVFANAEFHTYRLNDDGTFSGGPGEMAALTIAGGKAAWYTHANVGYTVWLADFTPDLGVLDATRSKLVDVASIRGLAIGSGWVAVAGSESALGSNLNITAYDLAGGGGTRKATIVESGSTPNVLTVVGDHVWVNSISITNGWVGLRRYTLSPP